MNRSQIGPLLTAAEDPAAMLFSNKEQQDSSFEKMNKENSTFVKEIRQEAERLIQQEEHVLPYSLFSLYEKTGSRLEYEKAYFARRRRLNTFAMMALLEPGKEAYIEGLQNTLWAICDDYTWCLPAHLANIPETSVYLEFSRQLSADMEEYGYTIDLFSAETAFALSEILSLTDHLLDPLVCRRVRHEVDRRIFRPYFHKQFHWETATHNWASVCAGSIGSAAIYLMEDNNELSVVLERVLNTMTCYLKGFHNDGACLEGYEYWQYGFGYYVYFADLLKMKSNGAIDLFQAEKVRQVALFQQKCFLGKNKLVNFSDSEPEASVYMGLTHYLHTVYPEVLIPEEELRASYTQDKCSRWAPAIRNLIWADHGMEGEPWPQKNDYFSDSQWFVSRHCFNGECYAFAAKGGHNNEPHNHNDTGHFMLYWDGDVFLKDLGSGEYNSRYFGPDRYSLICNGSHGHSVPIINHQYQQHGKPDGNVAADMLHTGSGTDIFKLDISGAYDIPELQQVVRQFSWRKCGKPVLTLEDSYVFSEKPESIVERFVTSVLTVEEHDSSVLLKMKNKCLRILFNPERLAFKQKKCSFFNHQGQKEDFMTLDFKVKRLEPVCTLKIEFQFE